MVLVLLTSLNCYISTIRLVHYTLLLTPAYWKSNNTNARLMAFAPSLALDDTFGIHSHKTLDTVYPWYLSKPNWKPSTLLTVFTPQLISIPNFWYSHSQCVCACAYMMYGTDQCHAHSYSLQCVCVFLCNTLCKLFLIGLCSTCV